MKNTSASKSSKTTPRAVKKPIAKGTTSDSVPVENKPPKKPEDAFREIVYFPGDRVKIPVGTCGNKQSISGLVIIGERIDGDFYSMVIGRENNLYKAYYLPDDSENCLVEKAWYAPPGRVMITISDEQLDVLKHARDLISTENARHANDDKFDKAKAFRHYSTLSKMIEQVSDGVEPLFIKVGDDDDDV